MRAKASDSAFFSFPRSVKKEVTVSSRASKNTVWLGHAAIHHLTHGMRVFNSCSCGMGRAYPTIAYYKASEPTLYLGAHALHEANQLLTRDRGFYRHYFKGLRILSAS
jgi:hypothetical protein